MARTCWALAAAVTLASAGAQAQSQLHASGEGEGVRWAAVPVRAPVALDEVSALPPYVHGDVPEVRGSVDVGPDRGAAVWLRGLEVVQLRADPGTLRFHRLTGGEEATDAWLRVEEQGIPVRSGAWYLAEPVGLGSVWVITASRPTKLMVERPVPPADERAAEALRAGVLRWVDGRGALPPLPFHAEVRHQLQADLELADALARGVPPGDPLHAAIQGWRKASALKALWTLVPLEGPALRTRWHAPPGDVLPFDDFVRPFTRVSGEGAWAVEVEGPGVLTVDARAVWGDGAKPEPVVEVEDGGGRLLASGHPPVRGARLGEDAALPGTRELRTLPSGERVGPVDELRVPLAAGRQLLRLRWRGGQTLLRVRVVKRRPLFAERWRGLADWPGWAEDARLAVAASAAPAARLLERQLAALSPPPAPAPHAFAPKSGVPNSGPAEHPLLALAGGLSPELRALVAVEAAEAALDARTREALVLRAKAAFDDPWATPDSELAWALRLRCARVLAGLQLPAQARELMRAPGTLPASGHLLAEAAEVLLTMPGGGAWRSRALAAMELAHRQEPLSLALRRRYRAAFLRHGRWAALAPLPNDGRPRPLPSRWLDLEAVDDETSVGSGALFAVDPGEAVRLPGASAPDGARLLRAFILTGAADTSPPVLHVGGLSAPVLALTPVEPVEVALPQGEHVVRLDAAAGTRAWLSIGPAQGTSAVTGEVAYLRTHFPIRARGQALRFPVPDAEVPGPVRLQLRAASPDGRPLALWIRTDVGQPRRAVLFPGAPSPRHLAVDERPGPGSSAAALVVHLPAHAREVWVEPDRADAELFVSVAVRRAPRSAEELLGGGRTDPGEPDEAQLARLLELSRELGTRPDAPDLLLDRAALLLEVGEEGYARDDLARALARQSRLGEEGGRRLAALLDRVDASAPDTGRFPSPVTGPVLLLPGTAALPGTSGEAMAALAARLRGHSPGEALALLGDGSTPLERYARARLLSAGGAPQAAALALLRLYRETDALPLGMDALRALERVQSVPEAWTDWGAPMGVALTSRLEALVDVPAVRRVRHDARRVARWQRLRDADSEVGTLDLLRAAGDEPRDRLVLALHAPPWPPAGTRVLTSGQAAVLELPARRPQTVGVEVFCMAVRADVRPAGEPCAFALRLDNREVATARAKIGEVVTLQAELVPGGRHQLELGFDAKVNATAAARFVAFEGGGETATVRALEAEAPMPVLRARPGVPVELTALGPTALRIEARAFGQDGRLTVEDGAGRRPRVLVLSVEADPGIRGAPFAVGRPVEALFILPDEGPHRLRFVAEGGEALVRVGLGGTRRPTERRAEWWTRSPTALEPLPWPALPERLALLPEGGAPASLPGCGTLSAELGMSGEYLDEGELDRPLEPGLRAGAAYRCEFAARRGWVMAAPELRHPLDRSPAFGATAGVHLRKLPLELRATVFGSAYAQSLGGLRYSAKLRGSVDRWIGLTPDLGLIPGFGLTVEHLGGGAPPEGALFDRVVYWRYGEQHPIRPSPRLSLRWQPLQDQVGVLSAWAVTNPELVTLDHVSARLRWTALMPFYAGARGSLAYEASYRMADVHRRAPYLRHGPRARLDVGFWRGATGRLGLYAEDALWMGTPQGLQNTLTLGVRWDWTRGRGLRDFMPFEEELEELVDGLRWSEGGKNTGGSPPP